MREQRLFPDPVQDLDLPKTVTVEGNHYPIRWDFATALRFMEYVDRSDDEDTAFLQKVLEIWYPEIPENTDEALTRAIEFYCGGDLPGEGYYAPAFPPANDRQELYAGFLERFGVDLIRDEVHWWVFRRLLKHFRKGGSRRE